MRKTLLTFSFFLCLGVFVKAQKTPEQMGGVYYAYPIHEKTTIKNDSSLFTLHSSLTPFYLSHYGRHGSRWLPNERRYTWVIQQFDDKTNLTPLGKNVRKRLMKIWKNARGNTGQLTPLGAQQHRQIAQRMYRNYPQLFTAEAHLTAHSSTVNRCKTSMENFVAELKTLNPSIHINPITREEDMAWMSYKSKEQSNLEHSIRIPLRVSPDRFVQSLFKDTSKVENPTKLLSELHTIASDMQDIPLKVSLYDIFTEEEMRAVYASGTALSSGTAQC